MSGCERCWADSGGDADEYHRLLETRSCSPEQQAGIDARTCPDCNRLAIHQHTGECMACTYVENG